MKTQFNNSIFQNTCFIHNTLSDIVLKCDYIKVKIRSEMGGLVEEGGVKST